MRELRVQKNTPAVMEIKTEKNMSFLSSFCFLFSQ
nr:unnamed protein product [Callosobruchus chinensis]